MRSLPIEAVAKQAGKPKSQGPDGAWARGSVVLLCSSPDWQEKIKGDSSTCSPGQAGIVDFVLHADHEFVLDELEVEGAIEPDSLLVLRETWIDRRLAKLRF